MKHTVAARSLTEAHDLLVDIALANDEILDHGSVVETPTYQPQTGRYLYSGYGEPVKAAVGAMAPGDLGRAYADRIGRGIDQRAVENPDAHVRGALAAERAQVAQAIALDLGYSMEDSKRFYDAALRAAQSGGREAPSAGRVRIGLSPAGVRVLSVVTPSGALYDPTKPSDPGNNPAGSD